MRRCLTTICLLLALFTTAHAEERAKRLIDSLHGWYGPAVGDPALAVDDFTRSAFALHFYDSVLVIEKRPMSPPRRVMSGTPSFLP